jgi:hypothetical protein
VKPAAFAIVAALTAAGCVSETPAPSAHGEWSNPFLLPGTPVRIQVDHVGGRAPSAFATDALLQVMADVGTPGTIELHGTLPARGAPYDSDTIIGIHRATYIGGRGNWRDAEGTPVLHVLYLDANYTIEAARGVALGGYPLIAIFPDQLTNLGLFVASTQVPAPLPEGAERAILVHEYGHVLGLVGCKLPQTKERKAEDGTCHSTADSSVMHTYLHQSSDLRTWAFDDERQPVWRFDADDWADIRAGQAALTA